MLYAQLIVYNKYSWLFSENSTHFRRGLNVAADVKLKYAEEINALRGKQHAAAEKMKELKDASDDAWETVKETADKVWNDLSDGLTSTVSKFK
jgi:hypothetical protein